MEEIGATNPKPLQVLWHRSCAHTQKTIPLAHIQSFTNQIVPSLCRNSWSKDASNPFLSFCVACIQTTFFHQDNYYTGIHACCFFFVLFSSHTLLWACVTPGNYHLKYSFSTYTYLPYKSLISSWIPTKFVSDVLVIYNFASDWPRTFLQPGYFV